MSLYFILLLWTAAVARVAAWDIIPLNEQKMLTVDAVTLRQEPKDDAGAVAPLRPGESVVAFASTYVTVREETNRGGRAVVTETVELWYKVKTNDGYAGWVKSPFLRFANDNEVTDNDR